MAKTDYSLKDLNRDFPSDKACIEHIFNALHTLECSCGGIYSLMKDKERVLRKYQCSKCRTKISPTAGTIFHKSDTPLTLWFHAVFVFCHAKSGISAKQMQRHLGVTYKCAYRILSQIRKALKQSTEPLKGIVETDAGYFGGVKHGGKNHSKMDTIWKNKAVVMVAVERNGNIRAQVRPNVTADELEKFVRKNVSRDAILMSDDARGYKRLDGGYERHSVVHSKEEYVRGPVHVNNVETWFAHVKRSITGTFKSVSKEKLQSYLDAFVFHYNNRHSDTQRFAALLGMLLRPVK